MATQSQKLCGCTGVGYTWCPVVGSVAGAENVKFMCSVLGSVVGRGTVLGGPDNREMEEKRIL